jgi:hypothetical protein
MGRQSAVQLTQELGFQGDRQRGKPAAFRPSEAFPSNKNGHSKSAQTKPQVSLFFFLARITKSSARLYRVMKMGPSLRPDSQLLTYGRTCNVRRIFHDVEPLNPNIADARVLTQSRDHPPLRRAADYYLIFLTSAQHATGRAVPQVPSCNDPVGMIVRPRTWVPVVVHA